MMDAWATFWGWLLVTVLAIFAGLTVVITIGGFFDIKALLATMDAQHKASGQDGSDGRDDAGNTD